MPRDSYRVLLGTVDAGYIVTGGPPMYDQTTWSRLARLKARKIYQEMQAEGLDRNDLPRKLREVAEREEAAVQRLARDYQVEPLEARLLLQLALSDEAVAETACAQLARGCTLQQAIAVIAMLTGEEYRAGRGRGHRDLL
jgi:hypothetical protein